MLLYSVVVTINWFINVLQNLKSHSLNLFPPDLILTSEISLWRSGKLLLQWEFRFFWVLSAQVSECGNHSTLLWSWDSFWWLCEVFLLCSFVPCSDGKGFIAYLIIAFFKVHAIFCNGINLKEGSNKYRLPMFVKTVYIPQKDNGDLVQLDVFQIYWSQHFRWAYVSGNWWNKWPPIFFFCCNNEMDIYFIVCPLYLKLNDF